MAQSKYSHARIAGISAVVPKREIRLIDEAEYYGGDLKKIQRMTKVAGVECRRVADPDVTAADLCQAAAENLFTGMGLDRASIDTLILVTQTPDYRVPATACVLQDKLGLPKTCAAFDVNQGCTAYTYGLWLASSLVESRAAGRVLLLVGEVQTPELDVENRIIAPIFGDCGTATIVEYSQEDILSWYDLGTDGSGFEALVTPAGRARIPYNLDETDYAELCRPIRDKNNTPWRLVYTYMDGGAIFDFTLNVIPPHLQELLCFSDCPPESIDLFVVHQANKQIVRTLAQKAGIPLEKAPTETFSKFGNQAGASLPTVICDVVGPDLEKSRQRMLLTGFGVGLSWASAVVDLDQVWCSGIREYVKPENQPTRQQQIAYWQDKLKNV